MTDTDTWTKVAAMMVRTERLARLCVLLSEVTMATVEELQQQIQKLNQAVIDDEAADNANAAALEQVITDLKSQLESGMSSDQIQTAIDALETIEGNLKPPTSGTTPPPETGTGAKSKK